MDEPVVIRKRLVMVTGEDKRLQDEKVEQRGRKRRVGGVARLSVEGCLDRMNLARVFAVSSFPRRVWRRPLQPIGNRTFDNLANLGLL